MQCRILRLDPAPISVMVQCSCFWLVSTNGVPQALVSGHVPDTYDLTWKQHHSYRSKWLPTSPVSAFEPSHQPSHWHQCPGSEWSLDPHRATASGSSWNGNSTVWGMVDRPH
jgi:hypothetical protein